MTQNDHEGGDDTANLDDATIRCFLHPQPNLGKDTDVHHDDHSKREYDEDEDHAKYIDITFVEISFPQAK